MKTLNVTFTDNEITKLRKARALLHYRVSWHDFILKCCTKGVSIKRVSSSSHPHNKQKPRILQ